MMDDGGMMGGMWLAGLFWLLVIGGGIALVVWAILRGTGSGGSRDGGQADRSLDILRERYARGEIDESEYREMRRTLDEK
jgi:putative membrane protein